MALGLPSAVGAFFQLSRYLFPGHIIAARTWVAMSNRSESGTTRPLRIYLGDLTYTTLPLATDAFPLNVGFVAAYASEAFGSEIDLKLFKYVDDLENAINEAPPDILGMSNYAWNFNLGLEFPRMARTPSPQTICVMSGPNFPPEDEGREQFVKRNSLIDYKVSQPVT